MTDSSRDQRLLGVASDDELRRREYVRRASDPETWFRTANDLVEAMRLIRPNVDQYWECLRAQADSADAAAEPEHSTIGPYLMLAGFAIENLCKGYLARRLTDEAAIALEQGVLPDVFDSHNVVDLAQKVGMPLSDSHRFLLQRIAVAIRWRGRYPVPKSHRELKAYLEAGSDAAHVDRFVAALRRHVGAPSTFRHE